MFHAVQGVLYWNTIFQFDNYWTNQWVCLMLSPVNSEIIFFMLVNHNLWGLSVPLCGEAINSCRRNYSTRLNVLLLLQVWHLHEVHQLLFVDKPTQTEWEGGIRLEKCLETYCSLNIDRYRILCRMNYIKMDLSLRAVAQKRLRNF